MSVVRLQDRSKSARVGIAFSSKDRVAFSRSTAPTALSEPDCDAFWIDGSSTDEGRALPFSLAPELPRLCEVHSDVVGGPDAAIVYALRLLLAGDYEYVGLVENDVLLPRGWLAAVLDLFAKGEREGLKVGAASARSFEGRMLFQRDGYAVMLNLGAGMVLFSREAATLVLQNYRTSTLGEIHRACLWATDLDLRDLIEITDQAPERRRLSTDWFYDVILMLHGYASLATTPALSRNIDPHVARLKLIEVTAPVEARKNDAAFATYQSRLRQWRETSASPASVAVHHAPDEGKFTIFPHQVNASMGAAVRGPWARRWNQAFGPFTFVSESEACEIDFAIYGGSFALLLGSGPHAGNCVITVNGSSTTFDLAASRSGLKRASFSAKGARRMDVTLRALGPRLVWYGLETTWPQPWFSMIESA